MYLSLPLPSTTIRTMTLTVMSTDGNSQPSLFTIMVPKHGELSDLIHALSLTCCLRDDETLLVAEVYFLESKIDLSMSVYLHAFRLIYYLCFYI